MTTEAETQEQTKARLFISYRMAQQEINRAIEVLLSKNPLHTFEEHVATARLYAESAADVLRGEFFDLENT